MRKRGILFLILVLFLLLPFSFAKQERNFGDTRVRVQQNVSKSDEDRLNNVENLVERRAAIKNFIEKLPEEKAKLFSQLSRARQKALAGMDEESALREMNKFRLESVNMSSLAKKRVIALEKLNKAREKFEDAKEKYKNFEERYREKKTLFLEKKEKLKQCNENCEGLKEEIKGGAKEFLINSVNRLIEHLNKIKSKIEESEEIEKEKADEIIAEIDERISELNEVVNKIENAETKEEILEARNSIKEIWKKVRYMGGLHRLKIVHAKIWGLIKGSENLEKRMDKILSEMREKGINIEDIEIRLEEFSNKVETARGKYEEAEELLKNVYNSRKNDEESKKDVEKIKVLVKEAHNSLKEAHRILINIIKDVKKANNGELPEIDENESVEVVEEGGDEK